MGNKSTFRQDDPGYHHLAVGEQITQLNLDGWPKDALDLYRNELKRLDQSNLIDQAASQMRLWYDAHRVGSDLFTRMFFKNYRPSQKHAAERIDLLDHLLGLELDADNFVQMTRLGIWQERGNTPSLYYLHLDDFEQAKDYQTFANGVARLMYAKYQTRAEHFFGRPSMMMLNNPIDHQLRYYLGKPMIDWVRNKQMTRRDLIDFSEKYLNRKVRYTQATYHNRGVADQSNQKIVFSDYHLEFIFDKHDQIVSIWNALENHMQIKNDGSVRFKQAIDLYSRAELQDVANTESLNYAKHGGKIHDLLDGDPSVRGRGNEPKLRDHAKTLF
ncbi:hypothetical protein JOC36_000726 [Weissella uvarum]|uniref:DUF3114 domain-containing protein n=1 Tax=Weissella uvarum TaxID=1479233 RepID=UPI001960E8C2|nr:DUF3114 domain-containing protein [Weissella uvarum]MBM7617177.1 hypothetical protein [Weissella uvarum]MCM0595473.1 DUF3114 domain-containing protein [Weissella uvarum]